MERYLPLAVMVAGMTAGGAILGVLITLVRIVLDLASVPVHGVAFGLVGLALAATIAPALEIWLPERRCQVSGSLIHRYSRQRAAAQWGLQLGMGVCTYMVTPGFVGLVAAGLLQLPPLGLLVCVVYGGGRGAVIAAFALAGTRSERLGVDEPSPRGRLKAALRYPVGIAIAALALAAIAAG
jgi:hypothetical protein